MLYHIVIEGSRKIFIIIFLKLELVPTGGRKQRKNRQGSGGSGR